MSMALAQRPFGFNFSRIGAREDFVTGGIMAAAILIFVGTASRTARATLDLVINAGGGADNVAIIALLLNVALIVFAWGRHKEAQRAMREREAAERRALLLKAHDPHTNLLNRSSLRERGESLIETARAQRGNVALIVINLDRFKKINDMYGDSAGDSLLRIIATVICGNVPKNALCARLGADEFAVALPYDERDEDKVTALAEDLVAQLNLPVVVKGVTLQVSASIGLSRLGFDCLDFGALLRRADLAMNSAKHKGGARPVWFDGKMEKALRTRNEVELGLERGIPLGEFVPYYQPLVEFGSGRIRGLEMLARWHHPAGGVVGPEIFIPVAEETGRIGALSEHLMALAFTEAKDWDPSLTLSVNISPKQMADPWLPHKILKLLHETGFPASRLEIEITESSLVEDIEVAQAIVTSLKNQGIRLSLDDFGTGYSSLAHLRALPFDRIKIDRSFVLALNKDPDSWTIVKTIANLGESLGVPITVEGVESAAIELRVRGLGCELGQGWFFGQPASASHTRQLLVEHGLYPSAEVPAEESEPRPEAPAAEAA